MFLYILKDYMVAINSVRQGVLGEKISKHVRMGETNLPLGSVYPSPHLPNPPSQHAKQPIQTEVKT